ncbi:MAG: META domain-containing protein [Acidimicrobiia bacterium]|nr:META domain-containing protein [Acidimicrobiia bacterium]
MIRSGRTIMMAVLPLLLLSAGCTDPIVNVEAPEEVETCEWLVPVGIELVNDYVYTLLETDIGATGGDPDKLPAEIAELNSRGAELDARVAELDCDVVLINDAIAEATKGIESDDPIVRVFLESVRGGVVAPILPTHGDWLLESGTVGAGTLAPLPDHPITLTIEHDSVDGFAGCNGYFYPVRLADGLWVWLEGATTLTELECVDALGDEQTDVRNVEITYIRAFELVAAYALVGDELVLSGDGVELRYVRSAGD